MNDKQNIKDLSYQANPLMLEVLIEGENVFDSVTEIGNISASLDYPNLTKYRVGEVPITLSDPDGFYAPNNSDNFFTRRSLPQDGYGAEIEIKAGFDSVDSTYRTSLFKGRILDAIQDSIAGTVEITATNSLHRMFTEKVIDFGIEKQFRISPAEERSINGIYEISDWVLPISDDSTEVKKNVSDVLTEVSELANRGHLIPDNYIVTDSGIETEGGDIEASEGYPQIKFKAPHKYRDIKLLINNLLVVAGIVVPDTDPSIANSEIILPKLDLGNHFASRGRIGYSVVGTQSFGSASQLTWEGYTTDFIYDTGKFYFLRNPKRGDRTAQASIIEYTQFTDTFRVLYKVPQDSEFTTEFWKIAKDGNNIAVLATDADSDSSKALSDLHGRYVPGDKSLTKIPVPKTGSYDSTEDGNRSYIFFLDISTDPITKTPVVPKENALLRAQIGHKYIFGQTYGDYRAGWVAGYINPQSPPNILPDTRHSFIFHGKELYFISTNQANTRIGVAKVSLTSPPSSVIDFPIDKQGNQCGLDFDILDNKLYYCGTFKSESSSHLFGGVVGL